MIYYKVHDQREWSSYIIHTENLAHDASVCSSYQQDLRVWPKIPCSIIDVHNREQQRLGYRFNSFAIS